MDDSPAETLLHYFEAALSKHKQMGFVGGCIFGNTALEMADESKPFAEVTAPVFAGWIYKME